MEFLGEKGMVLSGIALLLVLPALLLSATFLTTVEIGGETTAVQGMSDKISFKAYDIKKTLRYRQQHGERLDKEALNRLENSYAQSSVIGDISIDYSHFDVWVDYDGPSTFTEVHPTEESETLYDNSCIVKNLKKNHWSYNFEASIGEPDYDYNEPLLRLKRLKNGNWKVTVAPTFTHSDVTADVYWGNKLIFDDVNEEIGYGTDATGGAGDGLHEGESTIVSENVPDTMFITISLEDPGGTVSYNETFPLRKPEEVEKEIVKENLTYLNDAIAVDYNGGDPGGVEFSVKNNWDNTATISQIGIDPADPDINGLSDKLSDYWYPGVAEIYAEDEDGDGDAYSDFGGGTSLADSPFDIGYDGYYTSGNSPEVESGDEMTFYLSEFYDEYSYLYNEWIYNEDMTGEDVEITLTYSVRGTQYTKTFTITPS